MKDAKKTNVDFKENFREIDFTKKSNQNESHNTNCKINFTKIFVKLISRKNSRNFMEISVVLYPIFIVHILITTNENEIFFSYQIKIFCPIFCRYEYCLAGCRRLHLEQENYDN